MKVRDLIEALSKVDPDLEVVLAQDEEGNGYGKLRDIDDNFSINRDNEVHLHHLTPDLEEQGYTEEDVCSCKDAIRCVVLGP
jgi:hypothetical protein